MGERILLLNKSDVLSLISFEAAYAASKEAFQAVGEGRILSVHNTPIWTDNSGSNMFGSMTAYWPEKKTVGIKWFNMFSEQQPGYPAMTGHVIILSSSENGMPRAILAGTPITNYRTAAGHAAVAAKELACADASRLCVIGCGFQGRLGLEAIVRQLPIHEAVLWDRKPEKAEEFSAQCRKKHENIRCTVETDLHSATESSDVILIATTARRPLVSAKDVREGATVLALFSFNDISLDMATELDLWLLGNQITDQKSILENQKLRERNSVPDERFVSGDLCDVLCGRHPGRTSDTQRILYTHMGMAALDMTLALRVYGEALHRGIGVPINL